MVSPRNGSDWLPMASRAMRKHLQLAIALYLVFFTVIMYVWYNTWTPRVRDSTRPSSSSQSAPGRALHLPATPRPERAVPDRAGHADLPARLLVAAETLNVSGAGNASDPVGVREGQGGADHTLTSRLTSVFRSVLDCPQRLPLTFLGMPGSSADLSQDPACRWIRSSVRNAEETLVTLGEEMAVLREVTLNPGRFAGTRGGELIDSVFNQKEDSEYFAVRKGFFSLPCRQLPKGVRFHVDRRNYRRFNHLNQWFSALNCSGLPPPPPGNQTAGRTPASHSSLQEVSQGYVTGVTLALERYEYANVYHTMLDWYNVFLSVLILGLDPNFLTFLIVDGHPWGKLDSTWANLFGGRGVVRAGRLSAPTTFQYMVWVPNGYHCPLFDTDRQHVPFLPQLREYFFRSYGVAPSPGPQCGGGLRLLLVRRRDYLAHPRNPKGVLARKMANEDQVRDALASAFPRHEVRSEQLDLFSMGRQLTVLSGVDVLVGMHGAALTFTALLPQGAGLVEMYPKYAGKTSQLFKQLAKWRGVHYVQWMNQDSKNEKPNKYTHVPPAVVVDLVRQVIAKMCPAGA